MNRHLLVSGFQGSSHGLDQALAVQIGVGLEGLAEVIGEGTFGKVFKGLNERTGELIAIKQLCLFDSSDSKEIQSLRKEISVMWNLEHENIVR
jgi:hypothetical protein